jgi:hypothetical protein
MIFGDFSSRERRVYGPKPVKSVLSNTQSVAATDEQEQIRCRAYGIYAQNGYCDGYALDDWLTAEREVRSELLVERCSV